LENAFDGVDGVSDEFTLQLKFPDAGIFWYHPHIREDVQQALGLYGNILVREPARRSPHREEILMLQIFWSAMEASFRWLGITDACADGRFGKRGVVNGEPSYRLSVRRGEVVRFYLTKRLEHTHPQSLVSRRGA